MKRMVLCAGGSRILGPDRGRLLHANRENAGDLRMLSWLPENVSTYGKDIDSILYRRREGRGATYVHGNSLAQSAWILVPGLIVVVLDLWIDFHGARVWEAVKGHMPPGDVRVQVTGKQFNWEILYPGPG